ncbi:tesmin/TSO1 CXC domain-containing family protein [Salix suchowensis]|nr:tesmin/TSO1 CXC domain-containing family protein [Salix suchowensis]
MTSFSPPETVESVEGEGKSDFTPRKLVFTEFGLSPVFSASPLPTSPQERLLSQTKLHDRTKIINGTPKSHRQCHCKQSKCLKLYCECFASGSYCDECSCANCHNNVENEDVRREATECILKHVLVMAKHIKGCHCKRTGCLKNYCECFQANILCSENCKCVSCKNWEVSELGMVATLENHCKTKANIQHHSFSQESRKRTFRELSDSNMRDTEIHELTKHHSVNPVGVYVSIPTLHADCVCPMLVLQHWALQSLHTADAIHPLDAIELCSLLVAVSEAAKFLADEQCKAEIKGVKECVQDCKKEPDVHQVVPRNQYPGSQTDITVMDKSRSYDLMRDKKDKLFTRSASPDQNLNHGCNENVIKEHERLVLTCLKDCLGKLIAFGTMEGTGLPSFF